MKINKRSCGSENKKDLGEGTSRGEITKGERSRDIVVGGLRNHDHQLSRALRITKCAADGREERDAFPT